MSYGEYGTFVHEMVGDDELLNSLYEFDTKRQDLHESLVAIVLKNTKMADHVVQTSGMIYEVARSFVGLVEELQSIYDADDARAHIADLLAVDEADRAGGFALITGGGVIKPAGRDRIHEIVDHIYRNSDSNEERNDELMEVYLTLLAPDVEMLSRYAEARGML